MTDPWLTNDSEDTSNDKTQNIPEIKENICDDNNQLKFEDNFAPNAAAVPASSGDSTPSVSAKNIELEPLPDSATYLHGLERKLSKIKQKTNLVQAIAQKREDCMRSLLQTENIYSGGISARNDDILELDTPINNIDLYRQLQPIQPVTVGETVHIVKYDQLEQEREESDLVDESLAEADKEERTSR